MSGRVVFFHARILARKMCNSKLFFDFFAKKRRKTPIFVKTPKMHKMHKNVHFLQLFFGFLQSRVFEIRPFTAVEKNFFFQTVLFPAIVYRRSGGKMAYFSKTSPIYILFKYARHPPPPSRDFWTHTTN